MGIAVTAHACYGFDTDTKLTAKSAAALRAATYEGQAIEFAIRYVSIGQESDDDITAEEVDIILGANLALLLVQHVRNPGWVPSTAQGKIDGTQAAKNAAAVGYAKGCHLIVDLEGVLPGTSAAVVVQYVNAWADAVIATGYQAMVYVGYDTMLTPEQLYEDLPNVHAYWSDFGDREVAIRGFMMKQLTDTVDLEGVGIDPDKIMADNKGALPVWMVAQAA
jgi:Domain of unknown function (DUF1906)